MGRLTTFHRGIAVKKFALNGQWTLTSSYLSGSIKGKVPGSVTHDLLEAGLIPDPFFRDNEWQVREVMRHDFTYERDFFISLTELTHPVLVMEGLDTVASIALNDRPLLKTYNMHRTYRVRLEGFLKEGMNTIRIHLHSPIRYVENALSQATHTLYHAHYSIPGYIYLRKAHAMFGWDWGPQLPDAGIWRDIYIESSEGFRIDHCEIRQFHETNKIRLEVIPELESDSVTTPACVELKLLDPDGKVVYQGSQSLALDLKFYIDIPDPRRWYPNGYGDQPLYQLDVSIRIGQQVLDSKMYSFGLRTIELVRKADAYGESFTFKVNQIAIFAKGANYIIEDNLLPRQTVETTKDLLQAAKDSHHNMIRVWGGGIYPPDYFYEWCDRLGLLVWQDLMFACSIYELTDDFIEEIHWEIIDNIRRIRHHPSLALICGNNENEVAVADWNIPSLEYSKASYRRQYHELIPEWLTAIAPELIYWPSSPSSGHMFESPNSDCSGDMHYWGVWHNTEPFTYYRKYYPRFMSEFGLQSFPELKTVKTFALESDFNIFSKVMEHHQKNSTANSKILTYIGMMFRYPKDFSSLLYVSQLIQAEGIRYGVEHMRRHYGRCMGALYWQLNDCWPVASWSSIDYYHRYKALHYHSSKFYQPILLSLEEGKDEVMVHITNDCLSAVHGQIKWQLETFSGEVIQQGSLSVSVSAQQAVRVLKRTFQLTEEERCSTVFRAELWVEDDCICSNQVSFVPDKHLELKKPTITLKLNSQGARQTLELESDTFCKYVEIGFPKAEVRVSDNYFCLFAHEKKHVTFETKNSDLLSEIQVRSLVDSYL